MKVHQIEICSKAKSRPHRHRPRSTNSGAVADLFRSTAAKQFLFSCSMKYDCKSHHNSHQRSITSANSLAKGRATKYSNGYNGEFHNFHHNVKFDAAGPLSSFLLFSTPPCGLWRAELQHLGRSKREVAELVLVDGRDYRVLNGREDRLLLREVWIKVVDVLRGFLWKNVKIISIVNWHNQ